MSRIEGRRGLHVYLSGAQHQALFQLGAQNGTSATAIIVAFCQRLANQLDVTPDSDPDEIDATLKTIGPDVGPLSTYSALIASARTHDADRRRRDREST